MYDIFFLGRREEYWNIIKKRYPNSQKFDKNIAIEDLQKKAFTKMFWIIWDDTVLTDFDLTSYRASKWDDQYVHIFLNGGYKDGICLLNKTSISNKELQNRFFINKKEIDVNASIPLSYDRFFLRTYEDYLNALKNTTTDMFWGIWNDIEIDKDFDFNYHIPYYDAFHRSITHVFKNGDTYDGLCLFSGTHKVSQKEFDNRFFINKKEVDVKASSPVPYQRFTLSSYEEYEEAQKSSKTELFWGIWNDIEIFKGFNFDYYVPRYDSFHRNIIHVFKNDETYDGLCLFSKNIKISKKEFDHRFFVNKKEVDIVASHPKKFKKYNLKNYGDYLSALKSCETEMFWGIWNDIEISKGFNFDYYVPKYDSFHRNIIHIFKNGEFYDGICLFSKNVVVSKKEFDHRFFVNKKEVDIVASHPKQYEKFLITDYNDYLEAYEKSTSDLFWIIPNEIAVDEKFKFDMYFSHHNSYDRNVHHGFKHIFRNDETYNGISLVTKNHKLSSREINYRFIIEKKEWDIVASRLKPYDIIFISYNEPNADNNFDILNRRFPRSKRVHGIKGIHQAHMNAAALSETDMFFVVDGDAVIERDFNFDYEVPIYDRDTVHVWRSRNPINDLEYGYGGVKLLPKELTLNLDVKSADMTTSISNKFKVLEEISNISNFNVDEFSTWRSAFRECAKLSSKIIKGQIDSETEERLDRWCSEYGQDRPYWIYSKNGAIMGREFGLKYSEDQEQLKKINDFDWLRSEFKNSQM